MIDPRERGRIAQSYSNLHENGYFNDQIGGNERYVGPLMESWIPKNAQSLLEVGGASGLWLRNVLQHQHSLSHVTAVEYSSAAVDYQRRIAPLLADRPNHKLNVIQADFQAVASQLEPAEVVVSSFVGQYMGDPAEYLRQLYELTQPGGRVIYADILTQKQQGEGVGLRAMVESFALVMLAYLAEGKVPPLLGLARSASLYGLYNEPEFKELSDFHSNYHFPAEAWRAEQSKYPGAKFRNMGIAGLLMLPKPA